MNRRSSPFFVCLEEPPFAVREYVACAAATVTVSGPPRLALRAAVRPLLAYFAGENELATARSGSRRIRLAPASPVLQSEAGVVPGLGWSVRMLIAGVEGPGAAPLPLDPRVTIEPWPAGRMAVLERRGEPDETLTQQWLAELHAFLRERGLAAAGQPVYAYGMGPWIPRPWRRFAIMLPALGG